MVISGRCSGWPLLGGLAPWRGTFILAALPGLPIALAIAALREPRRVLQTKTNVAGETVAAFVREARWLLPMMVLVTSLTNAAVIVSLYWGAPTFVRAYGWSIKEAGGTLGIVMIVTSAVGVFGAGALSDLIGARNVERRLLLAAFTAPLSVAIAIAFGLVTTPGLALFALAALQLCNILTFGTVTIALQALTPGAIRGKITAGMVLTTNLIGAFAPTLVGLLNDHVFTRPSGIVLSITVLFVGTLGIASLLTWLAQSPYRVLVRARSVAELA